MARVRHTISFETLIVNTHFVILFVLVHLLSISVSLINDYYTISLLSPINVTCKYTCKVYLTHRY